MHKIDQLELLNENDEPNVYFFTKEFIPDSNFDCFGHEVLSYDAFCDFFKLARRVTVDLATEASR